MALANVVFGLLVLPESLPVEQRTAAFSWKGLNSLAQLGSLARLGAGRLLLAAIFSLNLAFVGLQTNFPLFSQARFGWNSLHNGIFYGYVGICAVFVQGILFRWVQPRLGERRLAVWGLALMALGLAGTAFAPVDWLLFLTIGLVALGSGVSIPSLTALISNQVSANAQGRLMGGMQALLSLASILGPAIAGVVFERIGVPAPYWLGALLAVAALGITLAGLRLREKSLSPGPFPEIGEGEHN